MSDLADPETLPQAGPRRDRPRQPQRRRRSASPVAKLVNVILVDALKRGASDIHIEPDQKLFRVRYRDPTGPRRLNYPTHQAPLRMPSPRASRSWPGLIRPKAASPGRPHQDQDEDRGPGPRSRFPRFRPAHPFGKGLLRLLDKLNSSSTGPNPRAYEPDSLDYFQRAIHRPIGLVLVTGPAASGKSHTLSWSMVSAVNPPGRQLMIAVQPHIDLLPRGGQLRLGSGPPSDSAGKGRAAGHPPPGLPASSCWTRSPTKRRGRPPSGDRPTKAGRLVSSGLSAPDVAGGVSRTSRATSGRRYLVESSAQPGGDAAPHPPHLRRSAGSEATDMPYEDPDRHGMGSGAGGLVQALQVVRVAVPATARATRVGWGSTR